MSEGIVARRNDKGVVPFVVTVNNYIEASSFPGNCNSIIFINKGNTIASVNQVPLQPEQSLTIEGNLWEWDNTNYTLSFDQTNGGTFNNLIVIRKVYQDQ
jgi:hypothetical protein